MDIAYDDFGAGEPLLLVHGHPFNRSMWHPQRDFPGWRVITPDLRGYGDSPVVPGRTLLSDFANDLAELLDKLGIERVVLAGLSMGGQIVMEFSRLYPERVRGLVLADTSAQGETEEGKRVRNETADRILETGMAAEADNLIGKMVAPDADAAVVEHVFEMMRTTQPEGAAAALRGRAERPDYVELLGELAVPALVVVGSVDAFTPLPDAELMHDRLKDSKLVVIDGAGHLPNLERPTEFNAALGEFLGRVS
ncbi:alpha/beta fold hydrolase [Amycolatopsis sp. cg5]|uniref:alpha/beta fold hydrolase n=1 Tax=Amycolatopsis sp. cg5 TaxID=3238802 RepID=UPI00352382F0